MPRHRLEQVDPASVADPESATDTVLAPTALDQPRRPDQVPVQPQHRLHLRRWGFTKGANGSCIFAGAATRSTSRSGRGAHYDDRHGAAGRPRRGWRAVPPAQAQARHHQAHDLRGPRARTWVPVASRRRPWRCPGVIFALICNALHRRDKEIWARQAKPTAEAVRRPGHDAAREPVGASAWAGRPGRGLGNGPVPAHRRHAGAGLPVRGRCRSWRPACSARAGRPRPRRRPYECGHRAPRGPGPALPGALLPGGHDLHHLRHRDRLPLPVGGDLPRPRHLRAGRDGGVRRRRARLVPVPDLQRGARLGPARRAWPRAALSGADGPRRRPSAGCRGRALAASPSRAAAGPADEPAPGAGARAGAGRGRAEPGGHPGWAEPPDLEGPGLADGEAWRR